MATAYSTLLGLALPVQGELSGTWGDMVDNGITRYVDIAVAGTVTLTNDGAVTLSLTNGDSSATNIVSSLTGAGTVSAQFAIIKVTGTLTTAKILTPPSSSRTYVVVNAATGSTVTVKASGQTGISVAVGETAFVYFNGTDYVKVSGTAAGAAGGSNTQVQYNCSGTLAGSANMTFDGATLTVSNGSGAAGLIVNSTANTPYLRFDQSSASKFTIGESSIVGGGGAGYYDFYAGTSVGQRFFTGAAQRMVITSAGLVGIATSSPAYKLEVVSAASTPAAAAFRTSGFADDNVSTVYLQDDTANAIGVGGRIAFRGLNDIGAYTSFATIQGAKENSTTGNNAGAMIFKTQPNGGTLTEYMRLTSTGNLGLGTTTLYPSTPHVYAPQIRVGLTGNYFSQSNAGLGIAGTSFIDNAFVKSSLGDFAYITSAKASRVLARAGEIIFSRSSGTDTADAAVNFVTSAMIDSSGNLGLGVTPSAWDRSGIFEFKYVGSYLWANNTNEVRFGSNAYYNGGYKYAGTGTATEYQQINGAHAWFNAASGTAGNAVTFTQRMTLDTSGNLGLGITSVATGISQRILQVTNGTNGMILLGSGSTQSPNPRIFGGDTYDLALAAGVTTGKMLFYTNDTERARISAAGGFSVGTTADPGAGAIYATGNITAYYSDARLKTVSGKIENALDKVAQLYGVYYTNNSVAKSFGYDSDEVQVGVLAQDVEAVLPQIVKAAPFDLDQDGNSKSGENYKTVQYDKLVPLLIEAINELQAKVKALESK